MAGRRIFLTRLSAAVAAIMLSGSAGTAFGSDGRALMAADGLTGERVDDVEYIQKNVLVTVRRDDDGKSLGDFFIDETDNYKAFSVLTPKRGQVFVRVAPVKEDLVEVTVFQQNGDVLNHSFSGVDTTLQFHGLGVTLVIGFAPDDMTKEAFEAYRTVSLS